jgi:pSer/pThr/pTyr-binding forkhead associated (FHA) protein
MASYNGAVPGQRGSGKAGLAPEPTRARAEGEALQRPQLGGPFEAATDLSQGSEPPPPFGNLPTGREEDESIPPPPPGRVDAFAEFEGAIAGESTRIDESDLLAEQSTAILDEGPRLPFLYVESGKDAGREYALQDGETSIGRGIDNDVILADVSVSRRHVRVIREGATITLRDLGSGNGTQLNGRRAHVEPLVEGDRIEIGETVMVVRVPGADLPPLDAANATHETVAPVSSAMPLASQQPMYGTPQQMPVAQPNGPSTDELMGPPRDGRTQSIVLPRRMLFIAAGAVAIVGSVIGAGVVTFMGREPDPVVTGLPVRTPVVSAPVVSAPAVLPVAGGPALPSATGPVLPPATGVVPPATGPVLPGAGGLPTGPVAPPTVPPAAGVLPPATMPATGPVLPAAVAPEVAAPPAGSTPATVAAVPEPERPRPGARVTPGTTPRRDDRGREVEPAPAPSGRGRDGAIAAYRSADFSGAARLAREAARGASSRERAGLERLADQIESFGEIYPRIRAAGTNYASVASVGAVAIRLDRTIASGHHTRTFQAGFLDWLLDQAESSFASDPAGACRQARSASDIEASARSRALLGRCDVRATEMMAEAGRAERSDPSRARDLYRAVLRIVPSGSREATEAQRHIDALGRTRSVDEDE